jgi:AraC family transcriptional regulator, positive regulator of tynA and feaB
VPGERSTAFYVASVMLQSRTPPERDLHFLETCAENAGCTAASTAAVASAANALMAQPNMHPLAVLRREARDLNNNDTVVTSIPYESRMTDDDADHDGVPCWQFDEWESFMRSACDNDVLIQIENERRKSFTGWARFVDFFGLPAMDHGSSEVHLERTARHARTGPDDYVVSLLLAGSCVALQNDRVIDMSPGDLILFDTARPARRVDDGRCFTFILPRQLAISSLGYEPQGGLSSRGSLAGRMVSQLAAEIIKPENASLAANETYMQMAVFDLFCAAFARPTKDLQSGSQHTKKLFEQVCCIIRDSITDPDLTPSKVAAEARIPLRYLQKLFTPKGMTCIHFIHSLRLDHAVRLLCRRAIREGKQPLSEIALASGFRDYTFFARKFRERFGCVPSAYMGSDQAVTQYEARQISDRVGERHGIRS